MEWGEFLIGLLINAVVFLLSYGGVGVAIWWFIDTKAGLAFVAFVQKILAWINPGNGEAKRYATMALALLLAIGLYAAACALGAEGYSWPTNYPEWRDAITVVLTTWGLSFQVSQIMHARKDPKLRAREMRAPF